MQAATPSPSLGAGGVHLRPTVGDGATADPPQEQPRGTWNGNDRRLGRGNPAPTQGLCLPLHRPPQPAPPGGLGAQPTSLRDGVAKGPAAPGSPVPAGQRVVKLQALGQGKGRGKGSGPALPQAPGRQVPSASRLLLQGGGWHRPWQRAWASRSSGAARSDGCRGGGSRVRAQRGDRCGPICGPPCREGSHYTRHRPCADRSGRAESPPDSGEDVLSICRPETPALLPSAPLRGSLAWTHRLLILCFQLNRLSLNVTEMMM